MKLPIFPLDLVLYPNQKIPLRIFEPRYRQMLDDCMSSDRKFGICRVKNGTEKSGWNVYRKGMKWIPSVKKRKVAPKVKNFN